MDKTLFLKIFIVLLIVQNKCIGQDTVISKVYPIIEYAAYGGKIVQHRRAMDAMGDKPYFGQEVRLTLQTTGKEYWHKVLKYPSYGLGLYSGYFNNSIIGNPLATYAFINFPFNRGVNYELNTGWGTGVAFNLNEYDSITNPENIAIASDANVYIDFNLMYKYHYSNRLNVGFGLKFQHFSNGALRHPNLGLNIVTAQLQVGFLPKSRIAFDKSIKTKPKFDKYEITTFYGKGWRGKNKFDCDEKFANTIVSTSLNRRLNIKRSVGAGIDFIYNPYVIEKIDDDATITKKDYLSYGAFLSSDLIAGDFRMVVQLGTYIYRTNEFSKPIYERVALRYYFFDTLFANISITAHIAKAQYIEWGIGATF